jgi:hypothetical protein
MDRLQLIDRRDIRDISVRVALQEVESDGFCELLKHVFGTGTCLLLLLVVKQVDETTWKCSP